MKNFETRLQGGHPNSLGNTIEVVNEVLAENALFNELFECYFSPDEIDGEKYEADELDSIVKMKKQLVDITKHLIENS
mgnify:FL=1